MFSFNFDTLELEVNGKVFALQLWPNNWAHKPFSEQHGEKMNGLRR